MLSPDEVGLTAALPTVVLRALDGADAGDTAAGRATTVGVVPIVPAE